MNILAGILPGFDTVFNGIVKGKSHEQGGVEAIVEKQEKIELEGGEVVINKEAVEKKGEHTRKGTNKKILNDINTETGGKEIMKSGGKIKNQYKNKPYCKVWDEWTPKQRKHFLKDHNIEYSSKAVKMFCYELHEYHELSILTALKMHVKEGQYGLGGDLKKVPDKHLQKKKRIKKPKHKKYGKNS